MKIAHRMNKTKSPLTMGLLEAPQLEDLVEGVFLVLRQAHLPHYKFLGQYYPVSHKNELSETAKQKGDRLDNFRLDFRRNTALHVRECHIRTLQHEEREGLQKQGE
jgi:hypothetical protein